MGLPRKALLFALIALFVPAAANADWQRGVDFTTYDAGSYAGAASDGSLARVASDGNDSVSIVVTQYMQNRSSSSIFPNGATPTDASLLHAMQTARALGLSVTLKPQIDLYSGDWRGTIAPSNPSAWFASYEAMIDHYADLARQGGATVLVLGTELKTMSGPAYTSRWQQIIAGVRRHYTGRLTYAANWNEYQQARFWGDLDYIGVDAYYPLSSSSSPSAASLLGAWISRGYVDALAAESKAFGKQVLFTEIGYRSIAGATAQPNIWNSGGMYDMTEEANAYEAAFQAFAGRTWFAGMYWWSWPATLPSSGWNGDYTPTYKPAENVMQSWNARLQAAVRSETRKPVAKRKAKRHHHRKHRSKHHHHRAKRRP
jgi:Glycoside Hydrolase Family 113